MMEKIVVVVEGGMVQDVYGTCSHKFEAEVMDLDLDGAESAVVDAAEERLQTVKQFLCKIYYRQLRNRCQIWPPEGRTLNETD